MNNYFFLFVLLLMSMANFHCSQTRKKKCYQDVMEDQIFTYVNQDGAKTYFRIKDGVQTEFVDNQFYAASRVTWTSCTTYFLVITKINYEHGLQVGDTLRVKLLLFNGDTISYMSSAHGKYLISKIVKLKQYTL